MVGPAPPVAAMNRLLQAAQLWPQMGVQPWFAPNQAAVAMQETEAEG